MAGTYLAMDRMSIKNGGSGGLIINTASIAGVFFGDGGKEMAEASSYFVAKHGVVALTKHLGVSVFVVKYISQAMTNFQNKEVFAETGVELRCVCPSFADTNIIKEGIKNVDEAREKILKDFGLMQ